jgi:hypothetical protein
VHTWQIAQFKDLEARELGQILQYCWVTEIALDVVPIHHQHLKQRT